MDHLLVAALIGATALYLYDLYVSGPSWARILVAWAPAAGYAVALKPDDLLGGLATWACPTISMLVVALLQWLTVARDRAMVAAMARR